MIRIGQETQEPKNECAGIWVTDGRTAVQLDAGALMALAKWYQKEEHVRECELREWTAMPDGKSVPGKWECRKVRELKGMLRAALRERFKKDKKGY